MGNKKRIAPAVTSRAVGPIPGPLPLGVEVRLNGDFYCRSDTVTEALAVLSRPTTPAGTVVVQVPVSGECDEVVILMGRVRPGERCVVFAVRTNLE